MEGSLLARPVANLNSGVWRVVAYAGTTSRGTHMQVCKQWLPCNAHQHGGWVGGYASGWVYRCV